MMAVISVPSPVPPPAASSAGTIQSGISALSKVGVKSCGEWGHSRIYAPTQRRVKAMRSAGFTPLPDKCPDGCDTTAYSVAEAAMSADMASAFAALGTAVSDVLAVNLNRFPAQSEPERWTGLRPAVLVGKSET